MIGLGSKSALAALGTGQAIREKPVWPNKSYTYDADAVAFILTSAGTATTHGLALDYTGLLTRNWLVNGGVSYTDAEYCTWGDSTMSDRPK